MVQKLLKEQGAIELLVNILRSISLDVIEYNRLEIKQANLNIKMRKSSKGKRMQDKDKGSMEDLGEGEGMSSTKIASEEERFRHLKVKGTLRILKNYTPDLNGSKKRSPINPNLLNNIINVVFKVLRNCCKSNTENSLLLFTHLKTFIPFLSLGSYTETFFIDAFVNQEILQKITLQEFRLIINQYIKIFKKTEEHSPEVFNLLINFILFDGKSISKNQVEIYKLFFEEFNPLIFQVEDVDGRFFVSFNRYKYELTDFSKKHEQATFTLAAQIKFFANLTFDRNYLCSKEIKKKFPL